MKQCLIEPVATAGFLISAVLTLVTAGVSAQEYIDLEAEREAARRESTGPQASVAAGAGVPGQAAAAGEGIRPYSGQTTTVTPLESGELAETALPNNTGGLVIQVQQLQEEVRRLTGLIEEQSSEIQQLKEQSLERYIDLDRRMADLAARGGTGPQPAVGGLDTPAGFTFGGTTGAANAGSNRVGTKPSAEAEEESAYLAAYNYVKARNFPEAVEAFQKFLALFPLGFYAPNAHYWLGELYLVITPPDPEMARQSFKLLLDQYPENPKVPDALYKLGKVHFLKGNRERSRAYLDRVIAEYPGHPAAQLSRDFLDENF